jgi:hypothetical protein
MELKYDRLSAVYRAPALNRAELLQAELESCRAQAKELNNSDLFNNYTEMLQGDDWEGAFTAGGKMAMQALTEELTHRLVEIGFLGPDHWSIHS